jgi:hypothetical protein
MLSRRLLLAAAGCAGLLLPAACGGTNGSPTATHPATATMSATGPATPQPTTPVDTPRPPTPSTTATPALTPPTGFRFELAPIDGAEVVTDESNPVQYAVNIRSGLPSGCHAFDHTTLTRAGTEITIDVLNRVPAGSMIACTAIYGTHETTVQLGSDFVSGATYRVRVNDRTIAFTAR